MTGGLHFLWHVWHALKACFNKLACVCACVTHLPTQVVKKVPQLIAKRMLAMRGEGCEPYQHKEQMRPADGILIERAADELVRKTKALCTLACTQRPSLVCACLFSLQPCSVCM